MKHGLNTDSPEELNSNRLIAMLVSVLLRINVFVACANYFELVSVAVQGRAGLLTVEIFASRERCFDRR